ncbi:MAG: hypothetical protein ACM31C_07890 [Acidobacteriota bacterium]
MSVTRTWLVALVAACGSSNASKIDAGGDGRVSGDGAIAGDAMPVGCPAGAPPGATCDQLTVTCVSGEPLVATLAVVPATGTPNGTVVHFSGGGGEGFETIGAAEYQAAGFQQVFVAWASDWEQTASQGIRAAACRPAAVLQWAHDHQLGGAFCAQGFSGGAGQVAYALAHYGAGALLDYANLLSGPPFSRIDLGCDYSKPATAQVCSTSTTMQLPAAKLNAWEHTTGCGSTSPSAADVATWNADSVVVGGTYNYPQTVLQFHDCTNQATAVTAMAQLYFNQVFTSEGFVNALASYHCYTAADGCQGEDLGTGANAAVQALIAGCTVRH